MIKLDERDSYRRLLLSSPAVLMAGRKLPLDDAISSPTREIGNNLAMQASASASAVIQLAGVIDDMQTTYLMLSRYPWHGTQVTKANHLELMWFLFQNLCYKFKEKLKLVFNTQKSVVALLGIGHDQWLKDVLGRVERFFQKEIRDRGNTVHSWNTGNSNIDFFALVSHLHEMESSGQDVDLPKGFLDVKGHYLDVKWELKKRAIDLIEYAEKILFEILERHQPLPVEIIERVDEIIVAAKSGKINLSYR